MEYLHAKVIADKLLAELKPFCSKIEIAGSIRRQVSVVKDIEIVLLRRPSMLYEFKSSLDEYPAVKGDACGRYTQRLVWCDGDDPIKADIFMPMESDYYRQLAIRTGPAEFSHRAIAIGWIRKGWVGTDQGLRRSSQCMKKGEKWVCTVAHPDLPPVWSSEQEFFRWVGLKYLQPGERGLVPC